MTDSPALVAALLRGFPPVDPANDDLRYDHRLNGAPRGRLPPSRWYPLPVLDPEVGRDDAWRRLSLDGKLGTN